MDERIRQAIERQVKDEPFALHLGLVLTDVDDGFAAVEADYRPEKMDNLFQRAHGGAIYGLIDEAFEAVAQTDGTVCVALNVNVTYVASPEAGDRLRAEARQVSRTKRTAGYQIEVRNQDKTLIATCQALAFRTGKPLPFL